MPTISSTGTRRTITPTIPITFPTALIRLHEMYRAGEFRPDFIIGVPVGFVNVVWAKELFIGSDVPYIINRGRKGGSNIAAAICNAVLYDM